MLSISLFLSLAPSLSLSPPLHHKRTSQVAACRVCASGFGAWGCWVIPGGTQESKNRAAESLTLHPEPQTLNLKSQTLRLSVIEGVGFGFHGFRSRCWCLLGTASARAFAKRSCPAKLKNAHPYPYPQILIRKPLPAKRES